MQILLALLTPEANNGWGMRHACERREFLKKHNYF
jgi:hypothetical protein